jgi:hypothetical protein
MDLLNNPTFAAQADIEFIEHRADYFPPVPEPAACLPDDLDSVSNLFYESKRAKSISDHVISTHGIRSIDQGQGKGGNQLHHWKGIQIHANRHASDM